MSLRFCMLTTFYPPFSFGGDAIGIERLCRALVRRGHRVTVVVDEDAWRNLSGERGEPAARPQPPGLDLIRLKARFGLLSSLLTQQLGRPVVHGRRIARILARGPHALQEAGRADPGQSGPAPPHPGGFDVINFHNVSLVGGPGLFKYGDAVKLYMAHEHWLVCPTHVLWRHNRERCDRRECLRCVLRYRRPPQLWRYTGLLEREARHVDAFIAMSEFSRAKHREFGFPRDMEVVNYFLPDPPPGAEAGPPPRSGPSPHPRPYFLFVGRLERIKGLADVIPLFRERATGADLVIAGEGEHGAELRRLAAGLERVRFLGRVPSDELARWYRHALALVVPSVCFETFGIILIEAFSHGTPVIARRLGPFPEVVEKARAGELFSTVEELLAAMKKLENDPAVREEYGRRGWRAYLDHWCESAVVPRYLAVVRRAAERKGRRDVLAKLESGA
jgi:glycosyltransferase involved in cell wall biosynthesis